MKKDNCKDCVSKCEHAGKDREFVCIGGVSCKVQESEDKVSVIRCKDCKYYEIHKPRITLNCERDGKLITMMPNDFCSYGERREQ